MCVTLTLKSCVPSFKQAHLFHCRTETSVICHSSGCEFCLFPGLFVFCLLPSWLVFECVCGDVSFEGVAGFPSGTWRSQHPLLINCRIRTLISTAPLSAEATLQLLSAHIVPLLFLMLTVPHINPDVPTPISCAHII